MANLKCNVIITGNIRVLTGLHIGASRSALEIGGVDSPVLRDPVTRYPYIPGSSLKGKMRMLTEFALNRVNIVNGEGKPCDCGECEVCLIYGSAADKSKLGPTRLIVRDAFPTEKTIKMWENVDSELLFTEYKGENTIDRLTSAANPRFFERVVPNSVFNLEMVYSIYKIEGMDNSLENDIENLKYVFQALQLLEHSSLGGHGSRGYGKVAFRLAPPQVFTMEDYQEKQVTIPEFSEEDFRPLNELNIEDIITSVKQKLSV